ncbi:hypothetical protein Tco_1077817 [Tanacetum coccineum]
MMKYPSLEVIDKTSDDFVNTSANPNSAKQNKTSGGNSPQTTTTHGGTGDVGAADDVDNTVSNEFNCESEGELTKF